MILEILKYLSASFNENKRKLYILSLLTIVVGFLTCIIIFFANFIDYKLNKEAYIKIDKFLDTIKEISYTPESIYCEQQTLYFEQYDYTPDKYANAIKAKNSCKIIANKMQNLEIPNDISENKKRQLFDIKNDYSDLYEDGYNIIDIQQKYKKSNTKRRKLKNPYSKDLIIKSKYLYPKFLNAKSSSSFKKSMKNLYVNISYIVKRKSYENYVDAILKNRYN